MNDFTSDDGRDDFILQERLSGKSARAISKQLRCTVGEVNAAFDRTLPILDNAARLRHISLDLSRLDELLRCSSPSRLRRRMPRLGCCV
jgi:hypothetical protein